MNLLKHWDVVKKPLFKVLGYVKIKINYRYMKTKTKRLSFINKAESFCFFNWESGFLPMLCKK